MVCWQMLRILDSSARISQDARTPIKYGKDGYCGQKLSLDQMTLNARSDDYRKAFWYVKSSVTASNVLDASRCEEDP